MKRKANTCVNEDFELDSLIENIQLMNCYNGYDEFKILKQCYNVKDRLDTLNFKEINEILKNTYKRYKRYLINVNMDDLYEIEKGIYKFLNMYKNETDISNWFIKYKELLDIMIKTDSMILDELDNYGSTKRYKQ
jgi:hypothetical protein